MYNEPDELFPLSWLSQYGYCPRRCGLLAIDRVWSDNEYTVSGALGHSRVHSARIEKRGDKINLYEWSVFSRKLGVSGKCDCVELCACSQGAPVPFADGAYSFYPVEYKHGVVRNETEYNMQLCAQAMCLEEQFNCAISRAALFYIDDHRRMEIELNDALRNATTQTAARVRKLIENGKLPPAEYQAKCKKCSLVEICAPKICASSDSYCRGLWDEIAHTEGEKR